MNRIFKILKIAKGPGLLLWVLLLFAACGSSQTAADKQQAYEELVDMVEKRDFEIEHQWAKPMEGNNISLIGNFNVIRFKGDSVEIDLPYFGVRHSGGGYGSTGGIEFEGKPENFIVEEHPDQKELFLSFEAEQDSENLSFLITLFPNGKATTSVNSTQRGSISFQGEVQ